MNADIYIKVNLCMMIEKCLFLLWMDQIVIPLWFFFLYRSDGNQHNLRNAAYEALMEMIKNSPKVNLKL